LLASSAHAETLEAFSAKCDAAIGVSVPDFNCDSGTLVPTTNHSAPGTTSGTCDRPNVLNSQCDPGSRFQVLRDDARAFVVAHCRKQQMGPGLYGDIAVIQYSKVTGATCFYQALGTLNGNVRAPSRGTGGFWKTPAETAGIGCGGCHDNGALIRSPYLTQLTSIPNNPHRLPGSGDPLFNRDQPYFVVGEDFASWRFFKVEVDGNVCVGCHRMGVSNVRSGLGTSLDLGIRATSMTQTAKNPHSPTSPIWMTLDRRTLPAGMQWSDANARAALEIKNCAQRFRENPLPNAPSCRITALPARPPVNPPFTPPPWLPAVL
jgi:hypothetical protein